MTHQRGFVWLYLIYALGALAVVGGIAWGVHAYNERLRDQGRAEIQAKWDQAVAEQRAKERQAAAAAETKLGESNVKAKVIYRTLTKNVDRVVTRELYRNVCLDIDGLSNANAAILGALPIADKPDRGVPKPDATR